MTTQQVKQLRKQFLNNKLSLNDIRWKLRTKGYHEERIEKIIKEILEDEE
jgi:hypothetical protein